MKPIYHSLQYYTLIILLIMCTMFFSYITSSTSFNDLSNQLQPTNQINQILTIDPLQKRLNSFSNQLQPSNQINELLTLQQSQSITTLNEGTTEDEQADADDPHDEPGGEAEAEEEAGNLTAVIVVLVLIFVILIIVLFIALFTEAHTIICGFITRRRQSNHEETSSERFERQLASTVHWNKMPPGERSDLVFDDGVPKS